MKLKLLTFIAVLVFFAFFYSCSKNTSPAPPVHDTTIVTKIDTITVAPPPDSTINLTKGLLLYLNFNGSIADSSGNNNPTYAVGNVLTYDAHGYANSAFNGDGVSSHVIVTNNGSIKFDTAFSVSFDFMITATTRQMLVAMVDTATGYGPSWFDDLSIPGLPNLGFYANDVSGSCNSAGTSLAQNPGIIADSTLFIPQLNTWYNVISIYHKGSGWVYINGRLIDSRQSTGTQALICPESSIVIGAWWNGDLIPLHGKLDEVRLYNRVLTPHEITTLSQHYQVTSESIKPTPVTHK